jgi:acyl carrier protein
MIRSDLKAKLAELMRQLFAKPDLEISDETTAADVPGWDSMAHINLVVAVEKRFGIALSTREVRGMKNIGALMDIIEKKTA